MIASVAWLVYLVRTVLGCAASSRTRISAFKGIPTCVPVVRRVAIRPVMHTRLWTGPACVRPAAQAIPIYPGNRRTTYRGTTRLDLIRIMRGCVFQMIFATSPKNTFQATKCILRRVFLCTAMERVKRQAQVALTLGVILSPRGLSVCRRSASGATAAPKTPLAQVDCATVVPALAQ